jgi:L-alanine-DL-glutamate epimerase-like enolase superfamily enzyme
LCPLPLTHPLRLGAVSYRTRDYVVLRLTTEDGLVGQAVGYTRSTPLFAATRMLCDQLGQLPPDPEAAHHALVRRFAPGWASLVRAASLIDIALWDLRAQRAGVTLAQALGSEPRPLPMMAVAGYFSDQRPAEDLLAEMDRFVSDGFSTLKLILPGADAAADRRLLERVRAQTPDDVAIAVDFHGAFDSVEAGIKHCRELHELGILFIEDPFPSIDWHRVAEFAHASPTPVAAGEDLIRLTGFEDLLRNGVQFLRADATASGGYTVAIQAVDLARSLQARVAPHVWPHVHAHLAACAPEGTAVEVVPSYVGAEPLWSLLADPAPIADGRWHIPSTPGLGMTLDVDAVRAHASDHSAWKVPVPARSG